MPRTDVDLLVIDEMERTGGSFVRALAVAALRADEANLWRIKEAFPEYWTEYHQRVLRRLSTKEEKDPC